MVKRNTSNISREISGNSPEHASARRSQPIEKQPADDIIMMLTNAHEKRRARQVFEWERSQPLYLRQAVGQPGKLCDKSVSPA